MEELTDGGDLAKVFMEGNCLRSRDFPDWIGKGGMSRITAYFEV